MAKSINITCDSSQVAPRLFFRSIRNFDSPSPEDLEKFQSTSYIKALDLISEGPIEGFCDATGGLVTGENIFKAIYYDETPVKQTRDDTLFGLYNFRNVSMAYKKGEEVQEPFFTGQGVEPDNLNNPFSWLRDFSYSSQTISKNIPLDNQTIVSAGTATSEGGGKKLLSQGAHTIIDEDVEWVGLTLSIDQCYNIDSEGEQLPNKGSFHIWGDITGVAHRSLNENHVEVIGDDGVNEHNCYVNFNGLALNRYKEDIFFKLKDVKHLPKPRPRNIYVRNTTQASTNFKSKFSATFDSVTEIVDENLQYPHSALIATVISAENFGGVPGRSFHTKLKKVKVPSNYVEKELDANGVTKIRSHDATFNGGTVLKGTEHIDESRHEGVWDGNFKEELQWTDNPAWILYDILTNDIYGLGEYINALQIDKWDLYKIAKYCDEIVDTSMTDESGDGFITERRFSCNLYISNAMDAYKCVNEIASIFRGIIYYNNLDIQLSSNTLKKSLFKFTNDNVIQGAFKYGGSPNHTKFTAVKVAYKDKEDSFLPKYEYIEDPEGIIRHGLLMKELSAIGCTSRDQALRLGRWTLLTSTLEEETVSFTTDLSAEYIEPGDVFTVKDNLRNDYSVGGRVRFVQGNKNQVNENFVLLDRTLDLDNYNVKKISFLIPSSEESAETDKSLIDQYKTFIHRNGYNQGAADAGERNFAIIDLNSQTSQNNSLHNYLENTPSGTKIITDEIQDLVLLKEHLDSKMDGSAGHKTFNDYILEPNVLLGLRNGTQRAQVDQKIRDGAIYLIETEAKAGSQVVHTQDFQLLSKSDNNDGTFSLVGLEYDSGKFTKTDDISSVYTNTTFDWDGSDTKQPGGGDGPGLVDSPPGTPQIVNFGYPKENTVDLIIQATGIQNSQGETRSLVRYYFHNTEQNAGYYQNQSARGYYGIKVQQIKERDYGDLLISEENGKKYVQHGQYSVAGNDCGEYRVLYDNAHQDLDKRFTVSGKALVGGSQNLQIALPNYDETAWSPTISVQRDRVESEFGSLNLKGCTVFGKTFDDTITGNVLSGEFELPDPNGYYELRWTEAIEGLGEAPYKMAIFQGTPDRVPPNAPQNFRVTIGNAFPNLINFKWQHQAEINSDLVGFRIYTGHVGGDNTDMEFSDLSDDKNELNTYNDPKPGSSFAEIIGKNARYFAYEADTSDGTIKTHDGQQISFGETGAFHIRAFDFSENLSDPTNSNKLTLFSFADAPDLILSGEMREEGKGTDTYGVYPILHAFYSGNFHNFKSFKKYLLKIHDETNGFGVPQRFSITKDEIKTAPPLYTNSSSGHLEIRTVLPEATYFGQLTAITTDDRESPEGTDRVTMGRDEFPPSRIKNFRVSKQWSNFKFTWDPPPEFDTQRVLLFTGSGYQNFGIDQATEDDVFRLRQPDNQAPIFEMFGAVDPNDTPIYRIDKFRDPDVPVYLKKKFPFHIVPVDTSNNTGMYTDYTYEFVNLAGPEVHTSGTVAEDGRSMIHVFYSGICEDDENFLSYETEYQDVSHFEIQSFNHVTKSKHNPDVEGLGSGHFAFEAKGDHFYDVRTRAIFNSYESNFSDDVPLTNHLYDVTSNHIYAPPDRLPPGKCTWIASQKNGGNVFLSWRNPKDNDLDRINLYTGYQNYTGEDKGTFLHQSQMSISELIPLRDFAKNSNSDLYFWLRAVDTSNNTGDWSQGNTWFRPGDHNSGQITSIGLPEPLYREHIICTSGVNVDEDGDGSATAFINYQITGWLNYQHSHYSVDLSPHPFYKTLVGSQTSVINQGPLTNSQTGSGTFNGLMCNKKYYLRARIHEQDGRVSDYTNAKDNPILTPKDDLPPKEMRNFYITSGPKQVFLEWDWSAGISNDISHIYVFRTGIPTGRINNESSKDKYCWKMSDISGYFQDNPDEYFYKLSASTSFTDNEIETGIFTGYGVESDNINEPGPKEKVYYFYFLQPEDRSGNRSLNFVSGISRDAHNEYYVDKANNTKSNEANLAYGPVPHNQGYVTGGGISAYYISNVYAGSILTDKITAADFILSHPSGRVLSDNVHARGSNDHNYDYLRGSGLYMDHKMFRIGNPDPGGFGIFWTGEKDWLGNYKKPRFSKDPDGFHSININPNTLEIRGNLSAGTIDIGTSNKAALNVDEYGNLSIGDQRKNITGFFTGVLGYSGLMRDEFGESDPKSLVDPIAEDKDQVFVQLNLDNYSRAQLAEIAQGGFFLETHWIRGDQFRGIESRQVERIQIDPYGDYEAGFGVAKLGIPFQVNMGFDFSSRFGNTYRLKGVTTTGTQKIYTNPNDTYVGSPRYRDWFRIHNTRFKVLNDGTLFAADAQILGTIKAAAIEAGQSIVLGDSLNKDTSIIQSFGYINEIPCGDQTVDAKGWRIRGDGEAVFKSIEVRSGIIKGSVGLDIGKCDSVAHFKVNGKGDMAIGSSNVLRENNFYVSRFGDLRSRNATISGDLIVTGTIDVGEGIRLSTDVVRDQFGQVISVDETKGIIIDKDSMRSTNFDSSAFTFPTDHFNRGKGGFRINNDGRCVFHDVFVTGGFLSGVSIIAGAGTKTDPFFKVFNNGEMSIGSFDSPGSAPKQDHPFYVSRFGNLYARNAYISGTITGTEGKIGSLYLNENFLSTWDQDTNKIRTSNTHQAGRTGLYLGKNGEFSIANKHGLVLAWNGSNRYVTATGIASSSSLSVIKDTNFDGGKGAGFLLQGAGQGSFISNFKTDPFSASGIAAYVQSSINGDITYPEKNRLYSIMTNCEIGYNIIGIYMETDAGTATVQWFKNKAGNSVVGSPMSVGTAGTYLNLVGVATNNINPAGDNYLICKPTAVPSSTTSLRFRVDLQRDNNFSNNH